MQIFPMNFSPHRTAFKLDIYLQDLQFPIRLDFVRRAMGLTSCPYQTTTEWHGWRILFFGVRNFPKGLMGGWRPPQLTLEQPAGSAANKQGSLSYESNASGRFCGVIGLMSFPV